jgi:hypothetical protein
MIRLVLVLTIVCLTVIAKADSLSSKEETEKGPFLAEDLDENESNAFEKFINEEQDDETKNRFRNFILSKLVNKIGPNDEEPAETTETPANNINSYFNNLKQLINGLKMIKRQKLASDREMEMIAERQKKPKVSNKNERRHIYLG